MKDGIAAFIAVESKSAADREIETLENQLIEAKKQELRNYVTQARNGFYFVYGNAAPDDEQAKERVAQILSAMIYGDEGFFFAASADSFERLAAMVWPAGVHFAQCGQGQIGFRGPQP